MAGDPSHFEIGVPDARRGKAFYGELLGWSFHTTTDENAWIETGRVRGGVHDGDDASNIVVYFRVPDLEAAVRRVRELGGEARSRNLEVRVDDSRRAATIRAFSSGCISWTRPDRAKGNTKGFATA
jgi:hypothetical protein